MGKIVRNALIAWLALTVNCCFVGEYTNVDDTCKQCDISCNTCKSSDGCSTCYGQMYLMTRGNMVVCEVCYRVNKGCAVCLTASKCSTCSNGYFLQDDNTCISCATMYPHCMLCTSNNSTSQCISCSAPYLLVNGECVLNTNSASQNAAYAQDNASLATTTSTMVASSSGSDQFQSTSACDPSMVQINGHCYPSIPFCQNYNQTNGQCLSCILVFVLNNGYCLPSAYSLSKNPSSQTQTGSTQSLASNSPATSFVSSSNQASTSLQSGSGSSLLLPLNCLVANPAAPSQCLQCVQGFTIVDALPGVCYKIN